MGRQVHEHHQGLVDKKHRELIPVDVNFITYTGCNLNVELGIGFA